MCLLMPSYLVLSAYLLSLSSLLQEGLLFTFPLKILLVVSFLHLFLQQGTQLTHIPDTELQSLKTAAAALAKYFPTG